MLQASLIRTSAWNLGEDLAATLMDRVQPKKTDLATESVMQRCYQCSDERWLIVMMPFREVGVRASGR